MKALWEWLSAIGFVLIHPVWFFKMMAGASNFEIHQEAMDYIKLQVEIKTGRKIK